MCLDQCARAFFLNLWYESLIYTGSDIHEGQSVLEAF
jgi:hypothetical protein